MIMNWLTMIHTKLLSELMGWRVLAKCKNHIENYQNSIKCTLAANKTTEILHSLVPNDEMAIEKGAISHNINIHMHMHAYVYSTNV